jgi:predicted transposase YdaD
MILGIRRIEESSVYQDVFAKGEAEGRAKGRAEGQRQGQLDEAVQAILRLGRRKLGQPRKSVRDKIAAIGDVNDLNRLLERILEVSTWEELLTPRARRG